MAIFEGLAGQSLGSNYGHLTLKAWQTSTRAATMAILSLKAWQGSAWTAAMAIINLKAWKGHIWTATMAILNLNLCRAVFAQQLWPS